MVSVAPWPGCSGVGSVAAVTFAASLPRARVAVVMRTQDRLPLLGRALDDVLAQTFTDWHLVVVNDGGGAAGVDALVSERAEPFGGRVTVLHNDTSRGMEAASNQGLRSTDSDLVAVHDDDDTWDPSFLARCVAYLDEHPEQAGVVAHVEIVHERVADGAVTELRREPFWQDLHVITLADLLRTNRFVPISLLYRRAVHEQIGYFDEDLPVVGDWEFHLRLLRRYAVARLDGPPLAFWHHRDADSEYGSSVQVRLQEHRNHDALVRDALLKKHIEANGMGDLLYLTGYIQREVDFLHHRLTHQERQHDELLQLLRAQSEQIARLEQRVADSGVSGALRRGLRHR